MSLGGALVVTAAVLVAAGCGGGSGRPSIVLYNGQHLELTRAIVAAFEKQTGISVRMRTNDGVVLADQILQEGHSSPADVYLTENSPELMNLEEHGLLARLSPSILRQVPARDSSPAGDWVGVALRVRSLVYDPSRLPRSKLPRLDPRPRRAAVEGKGRDRSSGLGFPSARRRPDQHPWRESRNGLARRHEAERRDLPG